MMLADRPRLLGAASALSLLLLVIAPFLLFGDLLNAGPVSDDLFFLNRPIDLLQPGFWASTWGHPIAHGVDGFRPLLLATYHLERLFLPDTPAWHRSLNYLVHGMNCALLAYLGARLGLGRRDGWFLGALFLLQPLHHQTLFWISGRSVPLATLCMLLAAAPVLLRIDERSRTSGFLVELWILIWAGCGLLFYEASVMTGPLVFFCALLVKDGSLRKRIFPAIRVSAGGFVAILWYLLLTSLSGRDAAARSIDLATLPGRFLFNLAGLVLGAPMLFRETPPLPYQTLAAAIAIAVILAVLFAAARSRIVRRVALVSFAAACLAFLPYTLAGAFADRFCYLPVGAFVVTVVFALRTLRVESRSRFLRTAAALLPCALMLSWLLQMRVLGGEWKQAGEEVRLVLEQTRELVPHPERGTTLHFYDVPVVHGEAYAFVSYFEYAVQSLYPRIPPAVQRHYESWGTPVIRFGPPEKRAVHLAWDEEKQRLSIVARSDDEREPLESVPAADP